jgi:hypothetical protein
MIAEAFVYVIAVTLLFGLAALSVEQFLAEIGRPRRYAWLGAYAVALLFPPLSLLMAVRAPIAEAVVATPAAASSGPAPFDWDALLIQGWALASAVLLLAYIAAWIRLAMIAKHWPRVATETAPVLLADDVGPAVLGIFKPRIVLPRWLTDAPASVQSTIRAHELEHIAARDQAFIVAAQLVTVLLPWNLPLWLFVRRLRAAIEVDCDARVLRSGVDPAHYADVLLAVGQRRSFSPYAAATLIEPVTQLERRIRIMLTRRRPISLRHAATATALAVVIAACASSVEPPVIVTSEPTALEEPAATTAEPATPLAEPAVTTPEPTQRAGTRPRFVLGSQAEPVRMVKGPNGDITVHAASVMVEGGEHTQLTADRITQTPDSLVLEGNVQLVFEGASMTATRAVAQQAADGSMTFKAENAVIATRRRQ